MFRRRRTITSILIGLVALLGGVTACAHHKAAPAAPTITTGSWIIGKDIPPGTYHTVTTNDLCYWSLARAYTGDTVELGNHLGAGQLSVTLKPNEEFMTDGCGTWTKAT